MGSFTLVSDGLAFGFYFLRDDHWFIIQLALLRGLGEWFTLDVNVKVPNSGRAVRLEGSRHSFLIYFFLFVLYIFKELLKSFVFLSFQNDLSYLYPFFFANLLSLQEIPIHLIVRLIDFFLFIEFHEHFLVVFVLRIAIQVMVCHLAVDVRQILLLEWVSPLFRRRLFESHFFSGWLFWNWLFRLPIVIYF